MGERRRKRERLCLLYSQVSIYHSDTYTLTVHKVTSEQKTRLSLKMLVLFPKAPCSQRVKGCREEEGGEKAAPCYEQCVRENCS